MSDYHDKADDSILERIRMKATMHQDEHEICPILPEGVMQVEELSLSDIDCMKTLSKITEVMGSK